jgi:Tol biopolymer transport system component
LSVRSSKRGRTVVLAAGLAVAAAVTLAVALGASLGESGRQQLVSPAGPIPTASRAAVHGRVALSTRGGDIWVMNANGSSRRRVTRSGRGIDFDPSWSPTGRSIVFRTSRGHYLPDPNGSGAEGIFVVDTRTRREREIQPRRGGLFPAWSPDGRLIAFSGLRGGRRGDTIHVMTPRGTRVRDLGGGSVAAQECATWSPDGRKIAYCAHGGDGNWALWVMNRDGSGKRQLTHPALVAPPGSGGDYPHAWSPDGKQIVYSSGQFTGRELYLINSDGTGMRRLTDWPGADGASAWLPSGEIVFAHFGGDERLPHWYLVRPDGSGLCSLPWLYGAGDPLDWIQPG